MTRFGHMVWPIESARRGPQALAAAFQYHAEWVARSARLVAWLPLALCLTAAATAALVGVRARALSADVKASLGCSLVVLALTTLFILLLGRHPTRLVWGVVPPMLVMTGALLSATYDAVGDRGRWLLNAALGIAATGWLAYEFWRPYALV